MKYDKTQHKFTTSLKHLQAKNKHCRIFPSTDGKQNFVIFCIKIKYTWSHAITYIWTRGSFYRWHMTNEIHAFNFWCVSYAVWIRKCVRSNRTFKLITARDAVILSIRAKYWYLLSIQIFFGTRYGISILYLIERNVLVSNQIVILFSSMIK